MSTNLLTDEERLEYQELNEFARHDDTVNLAVSSLLLPVLFGALAWSWRESLTFQAPVAVGSTFVWLYWAAITQRRGEFAATRYRRAQELECKGQLHHHLRIDRVDRQRGAWRRWQEIKGVELIGSLALVAAWIWLLLTHFVPERSDIVIAYVVAIFVLATVGALMRREPPEPPCDQPEPDRRPPSRVSRAWGSIRRQGQGRAGEGSPVNLD